MLINCPKCGFSQPQDKYCAQCGIDMETYRPAEVPFFKRLMTHPGTQFFVLLICLVGALQFFYFRDRSEMNQRIAFLQGNMQISSAEQSSLSLERNLDNLENSMVEEASTASAPPEPGPATPANETPVAAAEKKAPDTIGKSVRVSFYEAPKAGLQKLFEAAQSEGHFGDFKDYVTGMVENFSQKKANYQLRELSQQKILLNQNTGTLTLGLKDEGNPNILIGFQTYFYYQQINPNLGRLNVEFIRGWRESVEPGRMGIQSKEFPVQVELASTSALFISGIMPRQTNLTEQDEDALIGTPGFKILSSADFLNSLSEFVVVIEVVDQ